ncbi:MAG: hypothetical protein PHE45_02345, partial [Bacteroidales bacterium]|nr:hypothetical protein [Bacteroidales bacterium]
MNTLDTSIEYIKGVGPVKAGILKSELQIYTFADLMSYYPFRYVDKRVINKISEIDNATQEIQLKGYITSLHMGMHMDILLKTGHGEVQNYLVLFI